MAKACDSNNDCKAFDMEGEDCGYLKKQQAKASLEFSANFASYCKLAPGNSCAGERSLASARASVRAGGRAGVCLCVLATAFAQSKIHCVVAQPIKAATAVSGEHEHSPCCCKLRLAGCTSATSGYRCCMHHT